MAKYGTFLYGATLYGATANPPGIALSGRMLLVDWDNTGSFPGFNEADYLLRWTIRRGRQYYVSSSGNGFDHVQTGIATLIMDNKSGRYNPYLHSNIKPGRYFQLYFRDNVNQANYLVMSGKIADIRPVSGGWEQVQFDCIDGMQALHDQDVSIGPEMYPNLSNMINRVLGMAKWPGRWGVNIKGDTTPMTVFDIDKANALTTLEQLADSGLGTFFVARDGKATYYPRNYNGMSTYTFDQAVTLKAWTMPQPWDQVRNMATVICNRKAKKPLAQIWSSDRIFIYAHTSKTITAKYQSAYDVSLADNWTCTACLTTDTNTGFDETNNGEPGEDKKWWYTVTVTPRSKSADIHIVSGSYSDCWVTIVLQGRQWNDVQYNCEADDATSITDYGPRRFTLDDPFIQDFNFATAYAPILRDALKLAQPNPVIQIEERPDIQYAPDLFDYVHATSAKLGIDATYSIGMIEHQGEVKQGTTTRLYLQKIIYDTSTINPMPIDPDLPGIPEIPPPGWTPGPPPVPGIDDCMNDYYAPANEFPLTFGPSDIQTDGLHTILSAPLPCHLRAMQTWNGPTFITFSRIFPVGTTLAAVSNGPVMAYGTYLSVVGQPNKFVFNLPGAISVTGFNLTIPIPPVMIDNGFVYTPGEVLHTGTLSHSDYQGQLTNPDGPLVISQWYCIETYGGPAYWNSTYGNPPYTNPTISVDCKWSGSYFGDPAIVHVTFPGSTYGHEYYFIWLPAVGNGHDIPDDIYAKINGDYLGTDMNHSFDYALRTATRSTATAPAAITSAVAIIHNICA